MSRAINLNLTEARAIQACNDLGVAISAIEKLDSPGVRLVCTSADGAAALRNKLPAKIITGPVKRSRAFKGGMQPFSSAAPTILSPRPEVSRRPGDSLWRR